MKLEELKDSIVQGKAPHGLLIFIREPDNFLAYQYVDAICKVNKLTKFKVNNLQVENTTLGFLTDFSSKLKVLDTEVFDEYLPDYSEITNTVIICDKIDKKIKTAVAPYIIELPKLLDWQIKDYIKAVMPNIDKYDIEWLYNASQGNIYKIINELDKVKLFPEAEQKLIIEALKYAPDTDLFSINTFQLIDAILANDKATLLNFLLHRDCTDIEFMGIVNNLLVKAKQILLAVYQKQGVTAADIGCSDKQFNFFRRTYSHYSQVQLQYLINFLSKIDLKLKSGLLDMSKEMKIDYLMTHLIV